MLNPTNLVTFTEIPNILKVEEVLEGIKATIIFFIGSGIRATVTADSQYYITLFGETVTNVMDNRKAKNKRFFIGDTAESTAMSLAKALRNCSGVAADFHIINSGPQVDLIAKTIGSKWVDYPNFIQYNMPNIGVSKQDGSSFSSLFNSKIDIDVYSGATTDLNNYVTTLEKNYYGDECAFDMSPVLATMSEYGVTKPYVFDVKMMSQEGDVQTLGSISGYTVIGYHANQSDTYKYAEYTQLMLNKERGADGSMTLYTYYPKIDYSVLRGENEAAWNVTTSVKTSANEEIWNSGTGTDQNTSDSFLTDRIALIPYSAFSQGYYVDLTINNDTTRFKIIKPLKATEYCQRVLWSNEYGGISFFDFTSTRSESDTVDIDTYEKNVFDYYEADGFERKKIYDNEYKKTVSLTSHLMEEDGKWIFNSLMRSKKVWTEINNERYYIIPKTIDVTEDSTYNNIYTAKLTYEYSDI
jgi:hypothetical protein